MAASNQVFSAFSFISFVLTAIPFAWHFQAWNTGTCIYMGWIALSALLLFINSVVWNGNAINWAPIYCDIATKILVGLSAAIPAATLCINRRLYHIVSVKSVTRSISEKRRGVLIDLTIGVGIPMIIMILHVVVQGHRFDIYEDVGCWPTTYNTPLAYVLVLGPSLGLAIIACIYSILCLIILKQNYSEFQRLLSSNGTNATPSRYIRLMCLAGLEAFLDIPYNIYVIVAALRQENIQPWISWDDTHFDFNRFDAFPALLWRNNVGLATGLERVRWTVVFCGFVFFAFFGFADEALRNYKLAYNLLVRRLGLKRLAYIPGSIVSSSTTSQTSSSITVGFYGSRSDRNLPSGSKSGDRSSPVGGGEKDGGVLKANGTENWMKSFDAFADKVKLVILQSPSKNVFSPKEKPADTNSSPWRNSFTNVAKPMGHGDQTGLPPSVYVTKPDLRRQRDDTDASSIFTVLTEPTSCSIPGFIIEDSGARKSPSPVAALRRRSSYGGGDVISNGDGVCADANARPHSSASSFSRSVAEDSTILSSYSQPSPPPHQTNMVEPPDSPFAPPVPAKDPIYASPLIGAALLSGHSWSVSSQTGWKPLPVSHGDHQWGNFEASTSLRTPPRQAVPASVSSVLCSSSSPTPKGSFLDLSTSEVDISPLRDVHSADNRV